MNGCGVDKIWIGTDHFTDRITDWITDQITDGKKIVLINKKKSQIICKITILKKIREKTLNGLIKKIDVA